MGAENPLDAVVSGLDSSKHRVVDGRCPPPPQQRVNSRAEEGGRRFSVTVPFLPPHVTS